MTESELLSAINVDLKTPITWKDIDADEIEINHLKRIDKVFNKGLLYYTDPSTPIKDKGTRVFFRKGHFSTQLNIGAKKRVREFEDMKTQISAICKLSKFNLKRALATYTIKDDPKAIAFALRTTILPDFTSVKRDFLKNFINKRTNILKIIIKRISVDTAVINNVLYGYLFKRVFVKKLYKGLHNSCFG